MSGVSSFSIGHAICWRYIQVRKTAYGVKLIQKQRQYRTSSSSVLAIHVLMDLFSLSSLVLASEWSTYRKDRLSMSEVGYPLSLPLPKKKKTGQPVAQHRQTSFCYFTKKKKKVHMSRLVTKPTKWHVRPAKTPNSLGIRPVWSESLLSALRKRGSLATRWAHSEDSD